MYLPRQITTPIDYQFHHCQFMVSITTHITVDCNPAVEICGEMTMLYGRTDTICVASDAILPNYERFINAGRTA
jgi:hypothetical protein